MSAENNAKKKKNGVGKPTARLCDSAENETAFGLCLLSGTDVVAGCPWLDPWTYTYGPRLDLCGTVPVVFFLSGQANTGQKCPRHTYSHTYSRRQYSYCKPILLRLRWTPLPPPPPHTRTHAHTIITITITTTTTQQRQRPTIFFPHEFTTSLLGGGGGKRSTCILFVIPLPPPPSFSQAV